MLRKKNLKNYSELQKKDIELLLSDGVKLKARAWHPSSGGPWPAILMRQPYGREIASTITYPHPTWFAKNGFLVVMQDVRGQGDSEGEFMGFDQEAADTSETHNWVRSLPECNGLLGTYGFSYQGLTQLVAKEGTRPPECLAPAMTGVNENHHWACDGNAFWWHIGISWGLQLAAQKAKRRSREQAWLEIRKSLESGNYLREGITLLNKYDPNGMAMRWFKQSNSLSKDWSVHKPLKSWLKQPMLLIGGWWDPHLTGVLDIYRQSINAGGNPAIHIGPATHLQWWDGTHSLLLKFFQKHLKDISSEKTTQAGHMFWDLTKKKWHSLEINKPTRAKINWYLSSSDGVSNFDSSDGKLESNNPLDAGYLNLVHDPWRPFPSIGGHLDPIPGQADRSTLDKRTDVATFTTSSFKNSLQIFGRPKLNIEAFSDKDGFDLCVALSIIDEDKGTVIQLSTGFLRVVGPESRLSVFRKVNLQPIFATFPKGTKLRISIAGAAWPAIGVNPGNNREICGPPQMISTITTISMNFLGAKLYFSSLLE